MLDGGSPSQGDLDRLRDILFGQQARTTNQRLAELEAELGALTETTNASASAAAAQLADTHHQLAQQLEALGAALAQFRTEAQHRDDQLRQELLALIRDLEHRKTARRDLGQMLVDLGQRLQDGQ